MIGSLASPKDSVMKGSCLCGGIVYEIDPPFENFIIAIVLDVEK